MPQKKTMWTGIVNNQIRFFASDPNGNVQDLQGSRKFHVQDNNLVGDNGESLLDSPVADVGTDTAQQGITSGQQTA